MRERMIITIVGLAAGSDSLDGRCRLLPGLAITRMTRAFDPSEVPRILR